MLFQNLIDKTKKNENDILQVTSQLDSVAKIIKLEENEVATTKIQNALDLGGRVDVYVNNVAYIDKTLTIGDNTELNIKNGILREKAGTRNYMLVNKDMTNGNVNIKISGIFDLDGNNNTPTGAYPNLYPGHCIFFNKVKSINITNLEVLNAKKYAILIVDCVDSKFDFIKFTTFSDGIHFQPPVSNISINNITGTTGDDMVAFTLGDYQTYQVSNIGMFENIFINNIIGYDAKCLIKLTGSGLNNNYWFKNININNLGGTVTKEAIFIQDDGQNLTKTKLENITINGVNVSGGVNPLLYIVPTGGGDITFNNVCNCNPSGFILFKIGQVQTPPCFLDKVTINNVYNSNSWSDIANSTVFDIGGTLNNLIISNVDCSLSGKTTLLKNSGNIKNCSLVNIKRNGTIGSGISGSVIEQKTGSTIENFIINGLIVDTIPYIFKISSDLIIKMFNCDFKGNISTPIYVSECKIRIVGSNNTTESAYVPFLTTNAKCSINDMNWKTNYDKVNLPQEGDMIFNMKRLDTVFETGVCVYKGSQWKNLY